MNIRTGQTVYEDVLSLDADNNPVSAATFDVAFTRDGAIYTGITANTISVDDTKGIFSISWSADTTGEYQMYAKNNNTSVIFMSNTVSVKPDSEFDQNIFIGL